MQFHLARFDFREVENVVNERQKMTPRSLNVTHIFLLPIVQTIGPGKHIAETQNTIQWGSQFVAHRRQKIVFKLVHLVQAQIRTGEFLDLAIKAGVHRAEFVLSGD